MAEDEKDLEVVVQFDTYGPDDKEQPVARKGDRISMEEARRLNVARHVVERKKD